MSDTPQEPDAGIQEGGYGFPTLEQEVTPEVLERSAESDGSGRNPDDGTTFAEHSSDGTTPVEPVENPSAVEPTD